MPSGKSSTFLPVVESVCSRAPFASRGRAALEIVLVGVGMVNGVKDGPQHIAFELERTNSLALELGRVAVFPRDRECFFRISLRLGCASTEVIKATRVDPGIKPFKRRESCRHEIGSE